MSQDNDKEDAAKLLPGPGVSKWLAQTIGQISRPSLNMSGAEIDLPKGLAGSVSDDREMDLVLPDDVIQEQSDPTAEAPTSMVVIDLDVSVGTEDPEVLQGIIVQFSGLPDGVTLSAGQVDRKGVWTVPAAVLPDLSVIMPVGTEDFDLDVMMQVAGSAPQTASIQVVNEFQGTAPETAFMIRLAPSVGNSAIRFSVYADGTASYDRIIRWPEGKAGSLDVWVPYPATALPFEIVMRHTPLDDAKSATPKFMGIDIDGDFIRPDSPAIAVNGTLDDVGMAWQGDLVIDVRRALKSILTDAEEAFEEPTVTDIPMQLPDTEIPESEVSSLDILFDDDEHESEPDFAPDLSDQLLTPSSSESAQTPEPGILVMDASFDDLQGQAFTDELRRLRDFIRTRPTGNDGEVYARLGIDVTKWHDMVVVGPVGAPVELDPLLPTLAPTGGIDNTRFLSRLKVDNESGIASGHVILQGLAPGTLLTHGKNNGDGTWTIPVSDLSKTALLPQMGVSKTRAIHAVWKNDTDARKSIHYSLLIGSKHKSPEFPATKMRSITLSLEPAVFDPKGSQFLSLTLGDIPPGVLVSDGSNHGGGVWTLETTSGSMLTLYAAAAMKPFSMSMTCVALNGENGDSTVVSRVAEIIPTLGTIALRNELAA